MAAMSGIPSLSHAMAFWDSSSTCLEKYLPMLYPEEYSPLKSPQISDPSSINQNITYITKFYEDEAPVLVRVDGAWARGDNSIWR